MKKCWKKVEHKDRHKISSQHNLYQDSVHPERWISLLLYIFFLPSSSLPFVLERWVGISSITRAWTLFFSLMGEIVKPPPENKHKYKLELWNQMNFFQFDTQQIRVLCVLFWPLSAMRNISRVETRIFFFSWLSSKALFIQTTPSKATFRTTTKNVWNWAKTGSNEKPFLFPWHHTHREDLIEFQYPPSEGIKTDRSLFSQPEGALAWSMNHIHATHPTH